MKKLREIKEQYEIPAIGQTLSRDLMPQLDSGFLSFLKKKDISYTQKTLSTDTLKSTQSEFDVSKIASLMLDDDKDTIFVSNDNYVLDGHHRWIADHNTDGQTSAYVIDMPILEILRVAKEYESSLKEEVTHQDFGPMLDSFVSFASDKLGLLSLPKINYKNNDDHGDQPSFGGYNPHTKEIIISTKNRHPMDVFRTLAHELVHHKQNEDGRIKDVSQEGSTGSPIEDEANSMAGRLMRWFGKANPDKFSLPHIVEGKEMNTPSDREWGTTSLTKIYADDTPGEGKKKKRFRKKKIEEDGVLGSTLDGYNTPNTLPIANSFGPEFGNRYPGIIGSIAEGDVVDFIKKKKTNTPTPQAILPAQDDLFDEKNSVHQWHNSRVLTPVGPHSRVSPTDAYNNYKEFMNRHQNNREFGNDHKSVTEFMDHWKKYSNIKTEKSKSGMYINVSLHSPDKTIKKIQEAWEALGGRDMGTVINSSSKEPVEEDWQKVNRQDKTDGLSKKAVSAYRRENPGSKLKTAVTEKNPKGSRAKRRLSFCKRMGGMKKRLTSAETARDPDSRINKALRRWNCEE